MLVTAKLEAPFCLKKLPCVFDIGNLISSLGLQKLIFFKQLGDQSIFSFQLFY